MIHTAIFSMLYLTSAFSAVDFKAAFEKAIDQNPNLKTQKEVVFQTKEKKNQAWAALMPQINFVASYFKQADNPSANPTGTSIFPSDRTDVRFTASQAVFRGMREYAGISQVSYQYESQQLLERKAVLGLYGDVATQFYLAASLEEEIKLYYEEIEVNQRRLDEIKAFRNSGRSREADQLAVESAINVLEAQVAATEAQRVNVRETLAQIAGISAEEKIEDHRVIPEKVLSLAAYLKKSELRPDVQSAQRDYEASDQGVRIAFGGHFPSIDLTGNYYLQRGQAVVRDVTWDFTLSLTMPIFAGGGLQSQYRAAVSDRKVKEIQFERLKLSAAQEIKYLHAQVKNDWIQVKKLERASDLSERTSRIQQKDVKLGLVTNLDVLQAIATAKQTKRNFVRASNNLKTNFAKLEAATAEVKFEDKSDE